MNSILLGTIRKNKDDNRITIEGLKILAARITWNYLVYLGVSKLSN